MPGMGEPRRPFRRSVRKGFGAVFLCGAGRFFVEEGLPARQEGGSVVRVAEAWRWFTLRGRKLIELPATTLVWAVFGALAGWVVVATGWYVLATLWLRELFVSEAVAGTARAVLGITGWAGAVFVFFRFWAGYNYRRYHLRERRKLDPPALEAPGLPWSEAEVEIRDGRAVCRVADDFRDGSS